MLLGSTSDGILHHAKGPVMVVPDREDPRLADRAGFGPILGEPDPDRAAGPSPARRLPRSKRRSSGPGRRRLPCSRWTLPRPARRQHAADVGGKAANLGELLSAGLPVPDGFLPDHGGLPARPLGPPSAAASTPALGSDRQPDAAFRRIARLAARPARYARPCPPYRPAADIAAAVGTGLRGTGAGRAGGGALVRHRRGPALRQFRRPAGHLPERRGRRRRAGRRPAAAGRRCGRTAPCAYRATPRDQPRRRSPSPWWSSGWWTRTRPGSCSPPTR